MLRNERFTLIALVAIIFITVTALNYSARAGGFQNGEFITYSQDNWGTPNTAAAQLLISHFVKMYPDGIEVGIVGAAGNSATFTTTDAVFDYLPATGPAGLLDNDYLNPLSTSAGVFGGYVLALQFNLDFTDAGHLGGSSDTLLGDLILHGFTATPAYNGLNVRQFLLHANIVLGGGPPPYLYDDIATLTDNISRAFESGTPSQFAQDHLAIPCAADINASGTVNVADLLAVINAWGACPQPCPPRCPADVNDNCNVNAADLLAVINSWGACP